MATTTITRFAPAPAPIFSFYARVIAAWERSAERARIRHELSSMSTRDLADLGLAPSDINDVANGTYSRD